MDLNDYWQENKRFVTTVGVGLLVFFAAYLFLNSAYASEVRSARRQLAKTQGELARQRFQKADEERARDQNEKLQTAFGTLVEAVDFVPRPEFQLGDDPGLANNVYFQAVERVRGELQRAASRKRVVLPDGLGLEPLKTLNVETIRRHLEALDMLDRVLTCVIDAGVRQVTTVRIQLDPRFASKEGVGAIERTQIQLKLVGDSEALARFLLDTQSDRFGRPLPVSRFDFKSATAKQSEVSGEIAFLVVQVHEPAAGEFEDDATRGQP